MVRKVEESGQVFFNREIAQDIYHMSVQAFQIASSALPGQFVQVCVKDEPSVQFLRMPFAIFDINSTTGAVDICYQVVGDGTKQLSAIKEGALVSLVGPIGKGWKVPLDTQRALLACGGVGAPALKLLADDLSACGIKFDVVIGSQTKSRLSCVEQFEESLQAVDGTLYITTDDGSAGRAGFVNAVTDELFAANNYDYVAVCGPALMERSVAIPAVERGIVCEVSMEKLMACGIGACLGCVVETSVGLKRCCVDGPVFNAQEVIW